MAYRYFSTGERSFVLADCPGHVQYTRNTVTGASTADAAIVLIDARKGVLEQTRRHLGVIGLLRVPHVIVAVNKIDLIDYDGDRFADIAADVARVAAGLGLPVPHTLPVSALVGDNVVERSAHTPWYTGHTLLGLLESLPTRDEQARGAEAGQTARPSASRSSWCCGRRARSPRDWMPEAFRDYRAYAGAITEGSVLRGGPGHHRLPGRPAPGDDGRPGSTPRGSNWSSPRRRHRWRCALPTSWTSPAGTPSPPPERCPSPPPT